MSSHTVQRESVCVGAEVKGAVGEEVTGIDVGAEVTGSNVGDEVTGINVGAKVIGSNVGDEVTGIIVGAEVTGSNVGEGVTKTKEGGEVKSASVGERVNGGVDTSCVGCKVSKEGGEVKRASVGERVNGGVTTSCVGCKVSIVIVGVVDSKKIVGEDEISVGSDVGSEVSKIALIVGEFVISTVGEDVTTGHIIVWPVFI